MTVPVAKVLLVTRTTPYPPTTGGSQRTNLLLRALLEIASVDILLLRSRDESSDEIGDYISSLGAKPYWASRTPRASYRPWNLVRWLSPALFDRLAHNIGRRIVDYREDPRASRVLQKVIDERSPDIIAGRSIEQTSASGALATGLPVFIDVDDLEFGVYRSRMAVPGLSLWKRQILNRHVNQLERFLPQILRNAAHLWLASEADRRLVFHPSISILPNIPYHEVPDEIGDEPSPERAIMFIGAMSHRVNREGLEYFLKHCWARIAENCPGTVFRVYGSGIDECLKDRWGAIGGVEVVGFVDDIDRAYGNCLFSVVPLFEGGGTKIKVLESLSFGRTAVVTSHAQRGFEETLRNEESLLVAENADEIVDCCVRLLRDDELRHRLATLGHEKVIASYSYTRFRDVVHEAVYSVHRQGQSGKPQFRDAPEGAQGP